MLRSGHSLLNSSTENYVFKKREKKLYQYLEKNTYFNTYSPLFLGMKKGAKSYKYSTKRPLCVWEKGGAQPFYLLGRAKRHQELLHKLLREKAEDKKKIVDQSNVNLALKHFRLQCVSQLPQDRTLEVLNVLINRLGHGFMIGEMIFKPIKKIFRKKISRHFHKIFHNVHFCNYKLGSPLPVVTRLGKPKTDERGLWIELEVTQSDINITMAEGYFT